MDHELPKPQQGANRYLVASFMWTDEKSGWIVHSLSVHQPSVHQPRLGDVFSERYRVLDIRLAQHRATEDFPVRGPRILAWLFTPLLTHRGKPKVYRTMDAFYRDMKAIAGDHSTVVMMESEDSGEACHE